MPIRAIRANISPGFAWRLGLVALFCFGMAGWFLFDGTITYPRQRERILADPELRERAEVFQQLEREGRKHEWHEVARERDWPTEEPELPRTKAEIWTQLILAGVLAPPGLFFLFRFLVVRKRWVEADETGLRASWGQQLQYDQIVTLNKKKWAKKGIAKIIYDDDGRKRKFVLDDWKYEADPTEDILREVEARIDPDQIVGGLPEPPLEGDDDFDEDFEEEGETEEEDRERNEE